MRMTRRRLRSRTFIVMGIYLLAIACGILSRVLFPAPDRLWYGTYKDLLPLIIATPAAYLAFCFQQRANYVQALRVLWGNLIVAVVGARAYTRAPVPPEYELYSQTLARLSIVIEEARGVFENIPAQGQSGGWYPFEPIKQIHDRIEDLGYGESATPARQEAAREQISNMWKKPALKCCASSTGTCLLTITPGT